MGIAITEEHRALADSARGGISRHASPEVVRELVGSDEGPLSNTIATALAEQGLLGIHVPEEHGGAGYGLEEAAIVAEQFGAALAPGAVVTTMLASALLAGSDATEAKSLLPGLVDGSLAATVGIAASGLTGSRGGDGLTVTGTASPVLAAADSDVFLLPVEVDGSNTWIVVGADDVQVEDVVALDVTRGLGAVSVHTVVGSGNELGIDDEGVRARAAVVLGAEAAGLASWCLDTSVEYAKVREQFGRPIGQFQGVKHRCAEMLVRVEQARAAVWDASRAVQDDDEAALATRVALATAIDAAHENALECIQILGGIGFTWEHDAHLYLRRATTLRQILGGPSAHRRAVAELVLGGSQRELTLDMDPAETEAIRSAVQEFLTSVKDLEDGAQRTALAESGYQMPHWPAPWGRDASPIEQLVIDEEFRAARVRRPNLWIGSWVLPTVITYGTAGQQEQFILPTLRGEISWCQLFSEPGAGSDLAALQTKAEKVDGGWKVNGQKVWTSLAHNSDFGLLIARTDPAAPKHDGITAFIVDMKHTEGLDIRPLREMTGNELFNEIYLDDVFIPDAMVVGPVNGGWKAARNTLSNERVAMSSGSAMGTGVESVLAAFRQSGVLDDPTELDRVGALVVEGQTLGLLGYRTTLAQLSGVEPGAGSSVRKLVGGHHARTCADYGLELLGAAGAATGDATFGFLQSQCLTIAGGTTNVQLNVIAERLLGLPRDDAN